MGLSWKILTRKARRDQMRGRQKIRRNQESNEVKLAGGDKRMTRRSVNKRDSPVGQTWGAGFLFLICFSQRSSKGPRCVYEMNVWGWGDRSRASTIRLSRKSVGQKKQRGNCHETKRVRRRSRMKTMRMKNKVEKREKKRREKK